MGFADVGRDETEVLLRRIEAFMAKEGLDVADVRAVEEQHRSECRPRAVPGQFLVGQTFEVGILFGGEGWTMRSRRPT